MTNQKEKSICNFIENCPKRAYELTHNHQFNVFDSSYCHGNYQACLTYQSKTTLPFVLIKEAEK